MFSILVVLFATCLATEKNLFDTHCSIVSTFRNAIPLDIPCIVARFHSDFDFQLFDRLDVSTLDTYCEKVSTLPLIEEKSIVVILRGNCAFDIKVQNVEKRSVKGTAIIDINAINLTETPLISPGSQDATYRSRTPCIMFGKQLLDVIEDFAKLKELDLDDNTNNKKSLYLNVSFKAPSI